MLCRSSSDSRHIVSKTVSVKLSHQNQAYAKAMRKQYHDLFRIPRTRLIVYCKDISQLLPNVSLVILVDAAKMRYAALKLIVNI